MKYLTAREEDILTSVNFIQQGKALDKLLEASLVDQQIDYNTLLAGDKNALLVVASILAYGKDYGFTYDDEEYSADLSTLEPIDLDFSKFPKGKNEFPFKLPTSEREITFKLLIGSDEINIAKEIKSRKKISKEENSTFTTRLKHMILSVDGSSEKSHINNFIDNEFLSRDSLAFRKYLSLVTPDVDMNVKITDTSGRNIEVAVPITVRFFWPSTGV